MQKFGLAFNFWENQYKAKDPEVYACPQDLAKGIQSELYRSLGLPTTSDEKNSK